MPTRRRLDERCGFANAFWGKWEKEWGRIYIFDIRSSFAAVIGYKLFVNMESEAQDQRIRDSRIGEASAFAEARSVDCYQLEWTVRDSTG